MNELVKKKIADNDKKMKLMAKHFGNEYYLMFAESILDHNDIQLAIDSCWSHFSKVLKSEYEHI